MRSLAVGLGIYASRTAFAQPAEDAAYVGIETSARGGLSTASFFRNSGERLLSVPLDFRAHGMAQHGRHLAVFPRRPGNVFSVVDRESLEFHAVVRAPRDRHFYGHGAFSLDGNLLLVTENNLNTLQGSLGIYEIAPQVRRIGQVDLPGAGPHELVRDHQTDRFHVALGGLETHPDYGRTPLNLAAFRSQIVTYELLSGDLEEMGIWPRSHGVSLRHLAQDGSGRLYVGGQAQGGSGNPVVWTVQRGHAEALEVGPTLGGYVSSVAATGERAVVTSKVTATVLTLEGTRLVSQDRLLGASAVAIGQTGPIVSGYQVLSLSGGSVDVTDGFEFDNHGLALKG